MNENASIGLLKVAIGNPLTRKVLERMNHPCPEDGKSRLEVALELYVGARQDACTKCKLAKTALVSIMLTGVQTFGVKEADFKRTFSNPYWRKGLVAVVKGVSDFGVHRPFVPGVPFQVVWDVTHACNLRCKHCYASADRSLSDELTTAEALDLIDRLTDWGVPIIAFSGGEPLLRPDILALASHAHERGAYVSMATNGTLITTEMAKLMKEAGVEYLQISLDGADAETHDRFRGVEGCFDRTLQGIKNSVAEGFFVNVSTTMNRSNLDQIPDIIDLCNSMGVNWFMAYNFIPSGRGKDVAELDLSPEERERLLTMLYERNKNSHCQLLTTAPQFARVALQQCHEGSFMVPTHFYNQEVSGGLYNLTEFVGGCGAGRFYMAIRANGDIDPCVFFAHTVGNVRKDDLNDLWLHNPLFQDLRNKDMLKGSCGSCDYRYHCGGCRARAYGYFHDPLAPDPGCIRNISCYERLIKEISVERSEH